MMHWVERTAARRPLVLGWSLVFAFARQLGSCKIVSQGSRPCEEQNALAHFKLVPFREVIFLRHSPENLVELQEETLTKVGGGPNDWVPPDF